MQKSLLALLLVIFGSAAAYADVKFTKLSENQFVVHHRKRSLLGGEAKATNTAYREAASICIAAGFTHLEVLDLNVGERIHSGLWGGGRGASADLRVKFYDTPEPADVEESDMIECKPLADPDKIVIAKRKLTELQK